MTVAFLQITLNLGGALGQNNGQEPNTQPLSAVVSSCGLWKVATEGTQQVAGKMSLYSSHILNLHAL